MRWFAACSLACADPSAARFLVVDGREGDYALVEAPIPELADPVRVKGALGDGTVGGYIDLDTLEYRGGGPLHVRFTTVDDLAVPHTDDGLVLWSYYHTLSALRAELTALGLDVEPIFPVPFAYQPTIGGRLYTATNAAYAGSGIHLFALLADTTSSDLPLAANPGVIRHEFGHALFQLVIAGAVDVQAPTTSFAARALNEGVADALASLSLDDPRFIELSIPQLAAARAVDGDATTAAAAPTETDPYSRGTVYASLAWDLRLLTDPDFALLAVVEALADWADREDWDVVDTDLTDEWAPLLVSTAVAERSEITEELCAALRTRFPDTPVPGGCP